MNKQFAAKQSELEQSITEKNAALKKIEKLNELNKQFAAKQSELEKSNAERDAALQKLAKISNFTQQLAAKQNELEQALNEKNAALEKIEKLSEMLALEKIKKSALTVSEGRNDNSKPVKFTPIKIVAGESKNKETVADLLKNGAQAEKQQDYEIAEWNYQQVLETQPANAQANSCLGKIALMKEEFDRAATLLANAFKVEPDNADLAADYSAALNGIRQYKQAESVLLSALGNNGNSYKLRHNYGCTLLATGNFAEAEKELRTALKLKPEAADTMQKLALVLMKNPKENRAAAAKLYRQSRKLGGNLEVELETLTSGLAAPELNDAQAFLIQAAAEAEKSKDWRTAAWNYSQILENDKTNVTIMEKLAIIYLIQNKPDDCLKTFNGCTENITVQLASAYANILRGDGKKAEKLFEKANAAISAQPSYQRPDLLKLTDSLVLAKIAKLPDAAALEALFKTGSQK